MKSHRKLALIALGLMMAVTQGCSEKVKNKYNIEPMALTDPVDKISAANNKTAFKMLDATLNANKGQNVVISPLSLSTVLAMTQNGAAGATREEMLKALEMTGLNEKDINEQYKKIIANFNSIEALKIKMSNSIWIQKGFDVKETFINTGKDYYEAEISNVDFSKEKAADTINIWISDHTAGKIKKITDKFDSNTAMVLVNTVYFKGDWLSPFESTSTQKKMFTSSDGSQKDVDMMQDSMTVDFFKENNFEAIRLPYKDQDFGMYVLLPDKGTDVKALIGELSSDNWNRWKAGLSEEQVFIGIPKLHIEFEQKLNDMLKSFGMKAAFNDGADFSGINPEDLYISLVKQKCYIDVDEKGTEAAAATVVSVDTTAAIVNPREFIADRPFVFIMEDRKTGLISFMGIVEKP
ncbi:MAG: serpin family protein [Bacillota bacterium]|nr:serpin family protein [Bacillota bacterium]